MSYYATLEDALGDMESSQVSVDLCPDNDEHKVTLTVCGGGLALIISLIEKNMADGALDKIFPELKKVNVASVLGVLAAGEDTDEMFDEIIAKAAKSSSGATASKVAASGRWSKKAILDSPRTGDTITSVRTIESITGYGDFRKVHFRNSANQLHSISDSSWKGYGSDKEVERPATY